MHFGLLSLLKNKKKNHCRWIFYGGDEKEKKKNKVKRERDEGMKQSRYDKENTKEEKGEKEEKRDWKAPESLKIEETWEVGSGNFGNEKK